MYNDISTHYVDYGKAPEGLPSFVLTGDIPEFDKQFSDVLMMTGASDNHAYGSFNALYSMVLADPYASYLYIDLGISDVFKEKLFAHFETIHQVQEKMKSNGFIAYRKYNWNAFPEWMQLVNNTEQRGGYTWKMVPFSDAFFAWKAVTFWIDGGSVIRDGISREVTTVRYNGMYTAVSGGTVGRWVYPDMVSFMREHGFLTKDLNPNDTMGCGGHLIVNYANKTVVDRFMVPYRQCAYTQKCVTPRGSNMRNHRQDQAFVSVMVHELNVDRASNGKSQFLPALRQEKGNNEKACKTILFNLLLNIQNTYAIRLTNAFYNTTGASYTAQKYKFISRPVDPEWPLCVCSS